MSDELNSILNKIDTHLQESGIKSNFLKTSNDYSLNEKEQKLTNDKYTNYPFLSLSLQNTTYGDTGKINTFASAQNSLKESQIKNLQPQNIYQSSSYINLTPEYETRKMIEHEWEPYLAQIRKEFNLRQTEFMNEWKEYKAEQSDLQSLKHIISNNKANIAKIESDIMFQTHQSNDSFKRITNELHSTKSQMQEISKRIADIGYKYDEVNSKWSDIVNTQQFLLSKVQEYQPLPQNNVDKEELLQIIKANDSNQTNSMFTMGKLLQEKMVKIEDDINFIKQSQNNQFGINSVYNPQFEDGNDNKNELTKDIQTLQKRVDDLNAKQEEIISQAMNLETQVSSINSVVQQEQSKMIEAQQVALDLDSRLKSTENTVKNWESMPKEIPELDISSHKEQIPENCKAETNEELNQYKRSNEEKFNLIKNKWGEYDNAINTWVANMNTLNQNINQSNTSTNRNSEWFNQITTELNNTNIILKAFKQEQIKLNDIYEKAMQSISKEWIVISGKNKELVEFSEQTEENLEKVQDNFEAINSVIIKIPMLEKNLGLFTNIIKTLNENNSDYQIDVNNKFEQITVWQKELVENLNQKVNELKKNYDTKLRETVQWDSSRNTWQIDSKNVVSKSEIKEWIQKVENLEKIAGGFKNEDNKGDNDKGNGNGNGSDDKDELNF